MKSQLENPEGLHSRYVIKKIKWVKNPRYGQAPTTFPISGKRYVEKEYLKQEVPVDKNSDYFVLRLDDGGKDPIHINACRIAIRAYAEAIKHHLPQLSAELIEEYPLISEHQNYTNEEYLDLHGSAENAYLKPRITSQEYFELPEDKRKLYMRFCGHNEVYYTINPAIK